MEGYDWGFKKIELFCSDPNIEEISSHDLEKNPLYLNNETQLSFQSVWRYMKSFFIWSSRELNLERPWTQPAVISNQQVVRPHLGDDIRIAPGAPYIGQEKICTSTWDFRISTIIKFSQFGAFYLASKNNDSLTRNTERSYTL